MTYMFQNVLQVLLMCQFGHLVNKSPDEPASIALFEGFIACSKEFKKGSKNSDTMLTKQTSTKTNKLLIEWTKQA